jgi:hypothetical protein
MCIESQSEEMPQTRLPKESRTCESDLQKSTLKSASQSWETKKPTTGFEAKPGETVATSFEAKLEKTVTTGFEVKPLTNRTSGFEVKSLTNRQPWFWGSTKNPRS